MCMYVCLHERQAQEKLYELYLFIVNKKNKRHLDSFRTVLELLSLWVYRAHYYEDALRK